MTWPAGIRMLDRKLLRDLWAMRGQAAAIATVIAAGLAMFIAYFSNFESLQRARASYYDRARFADVFAAVNRAPLSIESRVRTLPGVAHTATRVVADVTLDIPGLADPATGRLISVRGTARPSLNDLVLRRGRWLDPTGDDEVIASEAFVDAHHFEPGDTIAAIINGRRRQLTIVGVALSPEYIYAIRPGELVPDPARFGVFWMDERALASALDMDGAFNDITVDLAGDTPSASVIADLDRLLEPYGGRGAIPRSQQLSAWTVDNELRQLQTFGFIVPLIFMAVAAFILHVALTRALALQRTQIAALKALGHSNAGLAWHYTKWALAIAFIGAATGVLAGAWLGAALTRLYNVYFHFPALTYRLSGLLVLEAVGGSLAIAAAGAQAAVRRAVRVPPAEAMRPEGPARYRRSVVEVRWRPLRLTFASRMIARTIERQPVRAAVSILGIGLGVAVLFVGLAFLDIMDRLIDDQFSRAMRYDAVVTLANPRGARAVHAVRGLPGVLDVEPIRVAPVRLRAGTRSRSVGLTGLPPTPRLMRIITGTGAAALAVPDDGLLLSRALGEVLGVAPGDQIDVHVLEGRRAQESMLVAGLIDDRFGLQAYVHIGRLHRLLREGDTVSAVAVTLDPAARETFATRIKATPTIAGVALRDATVRNFERMMAENMNLQIFTNVIFAIIIAFGVVYNSARVSLSEHSRELASLRVLGFSKSEISEILLGELAVLTAIALPIGTVIGWLLGELIMRSLSNEMYRLTFEVVPSTIAWAWLTTIGASLASAFVVRRRLDRLDLIAVLKTSE